MAAHPAGAAAAAPELSPAAAAAVAVVAGRGLRLLAAAQQRARAAPVQQQQQRQMVPLLALLACLKGLACLQPRAHASVQGRAVPVAAALVAMARHRMGRALLLQRPAGGSQSPGPGRRRGSSRTGRRAVTPPPAHLQCGQREACQAEGGQGVGRGRGGSEGRECSAVRSHERGAHAELRTSTL